MKTTFLSFLIFLISYNLIAQEPTQIFLFSIAIEPDTIAIGTLIDWQQNDGYNNQPFFISNDEILFASDNPTAPDIRKYDSSTNESQWIHSPTEGGEYSPQRRPDTDNITAVRLDSDGLQRLYMYDTYTKNWTTLLEHIAIAYYSFYDKDTLLATVLNESEMDLVLANIATQQVDTLASQAGRVVGRVPDTNLMTYTLLNEAEEFDLYTFDPETGESVFICQLPYTVQDAIWLDDTRILAASGYRLFIYDTWGEDSWEYAGSTERFGVTDITRMALSPDGKKLAVVGKKKP